MQKMSINRVILVGRVGGDPETRSTKTGTSVASFSLATNESMMKSDGKKNEHTEWHNVVSMGKQADFVSEYIKKGQLLSIEGRLRTNKWEGNDNVTRYKTEIYTDSVTPLEWRNDDDSANDSNASGVSEPENEEEVLPF